MNDYLKSKRLIYGVCMVLLCIGITHGENAPESGKGAERPSLAQFDEDVAVCRRVIRQYCAIVQEMMREKIVDLEKQEKGLVLLKEARRQWADIQKKYASNPPPEYAADPQFKGRLQDITNAAEDMENALAVGDARRSMRACGFGCGLFVLMHEENGLTYALNKLFHLRRTARIAGAVFRTKGLDAVAPLMPQLLSQRDEVMLAPVPWPAGDPRNDDYLEGIRALSSAIDELAVAVTIKDNKKAGAVLNGLVPVINKPYGTAL